MILPHFSPYGQSSKTKSGMELAKVAHVRQSLMWCSLSHSSGNSPHSPFLTDSTMALTSISRFWSTKSSLHLLLFRFQFFSKTISKLKNVISCTFVSHVLLQHHFHHHFLEHIVLLDLLLLSSEDELYSGLLLLSRHLLHALQGSHNLHLFHVLVAIEHGVNKSVWGFVHWKI